MEMNLVAVIVAVLGAGGIGAAIREIFGVVTLARQGMSGKEDKRRTDIVAQRDHALALQADAEAGERAADARADREADHRRLWQEEASRLRLMIIDLGADPGPRLVIPTVPSGGHTS
ncbi:hypothetical protein [Microbacterium maritypicum]